MLDLFRCTGCGDLVYSDDTPMHNTCCEGFVLEDLDQDLDENIDCFLEDMHLDLESTSYFFPLH